MPQNQQLQTQPKKSNYLINFDEEQQAIIKAQFFPPNATPLEIDFCMSVAKSFGLNPIINEIYFIERKANVNGNWITKVEPLAGRNAYRKIANRSGELESIEVDTVLKDTPKLINSEWVEGKDLVAVCTIYKKGNTNPFVVEVEYSEYVQTKKDGTPTKFWSEKPKTMLKKVAESQCLRMAFDINGLYDESEIEEVDIQPQYVNPKLTQPPKTKTAKRRNPTKKEMKAQEFIDVETGEVFTQEVMQPQEAPQQQEPPKTSCSFAYSTFLQKGIKRSDLVGFCDFLKVEANITNDDALTILLEDTELFEVQKNAFYGVA